jgi:hypothetical protein
MFNNLFRKINLNNMAKKNSNDNSGQSKKVRLSEQKKEKRTFTKQEDGRGTGPGKKEDKK